MSGERLYLRARAVPSERRDGYGRAVREGFGAVSGVTWARYDRPLGCVVVSTEGAVSPDRLAMVLDGIDAAQDLLAQPFATVPVPLDDDAERRLRLERAIDAAGTAVAFARKVLGAKKRAAPVDLAAALTVLSSTPALRGLLEKRFGEAEVELAFASGAALTGAWQGSLAAPLADVLAREVRLRALRAQRRAFEEREPTLGVDPHAHRAEDEAPPQRSRPLPPGLLEGWSSRVTLAGIGAFGLGLTATRSVASASAPLFGAAPKAGHLARQGFVDALTERLGERGALVATAHRLEVLDRVDALVVAPAVLEADERLREALEAQARALHLELHVSDDPAVVRDRIADGRVVLAAGVAPGAADLEVDVSWGGDVVLRTWAQLRFLIEAIDGARQATEQGVRIATLQSVAGLILSIRGMSVKEASRVALGANVAGALALLDGVRLARAVEPRPLAGPKERVPWHAADRDAVLERLGSSRSGLTASEATRRRPEPIPEPSERDRFLADLVAELDTPLTPVLLAGAGLSALTGAVLDATMLASVMGMDAVLGAVQRGRTERDLAQLANREAPQVRVRRDDVERSVSVGELVVGDVIELDAGDRVPADCRLLHSRGLEVDEASLTGESNTVAKSSSRPCPAEAPVADRHTMVWEGTTIAAGSGKAVVVAVGNDTEARRGVALAGAVPTTGVERRLASLTSSVTPVAALSGLALMASGMARGRPAKEVIGAGVSLAAAAVPEGLPIVATMAQLAAAKRLAKRGALVTNPRALEALGRVGVLCADKTGTLTEGRIAARLVDDGSRSAAPGEDEALEAVMLTALRAGPRVDVPMAHPTDRAIHGGATHLHGRAREPKWRRVAEIPFDPERGFHAVLGDTHRERVLCLKGEPEGTLERCGSDAAGPLDDERRRQLTERIGELASQGLRVLAVARRSVPAETDAIDDALDGELTFVGFVGLADPARPSARAAIEAIGEAGVSVVMITGDHPRTARAIADQLGLGEGLLTGRELDSLDDEALTRAIGETHVFARVTPAQKVRIVRAFQGRGEAVAMTGDGANDAPAIRLADVGVALGERATGSARAAADIVVADERIETIVDAILEGRALWTSVRDAVSLLVGGNLGEIVYTLSSGIFSGRSPLNTRQLLLVNILTDTIPAIAVAVMPPREDEPERLAAEGPDASLGESLARDVMWRALVIGGATSLTWAMARPLGTEKRADTIALLTMVGGQMAQTILVAPRSKLVLGSSLGSLALLLGIVETPGVSHFFGCKPLGPLALTQAISGTLGAAAASALAPAVARKLAPSLAGPARAIERELRWWADALADDELLAALTGE